MEKRKGLLRGAPRGRRDTAKGLETRENLAFREDASTCWKRKECGRR